MNSPSFFKSVSTFSKISLSPSLWAKTLKAVTTSAFPYFFIIFLTVFSSKYSGNVVSFLEFAISAIFLAGSTPIALKPYSIVTSYVNK